MLHGPGRLPDKPNLYVGADCDGQSSSDCGAHLTDSMIGSSKVRKHFRAIRFDLFEDLAALRVEGRRAQRYPSVSMRSPRSVLRVSLADKLHNARSIETDLADPICR